MGVMYQVAELFIHSTTRFLRVHFCSADFNCTTEKSRECMRSSSERRKRQNNNSTPHTKRPTFKAGFCRKCCKRHFSHIPCNFCLERECHWGVHKIAGYVNTVCSPATPFPIRANMSEEQIKLKGGCPNLD